MVNYLLTSFFFHVALMLALVYTVPVNTSSGDRIEVNIVQTPKFHRQPPILNYSRKYAKPGDGPLGGKKVEKIDLNDYATKLKSIVDPIWCAKIMRFHLPPTVFLATEVLIFPDKYGMIVSVKITKSSGNRDFDRIVIETLREVRQIPKPSDSLVKEGIIWEFSNGERS